MNKKKILGIALIIAIFVGLFITVVYVFNELKEENDIRIQNIDTTDAKKFKTEYEEYNNQETEDGKKYRTLEISENNPIKYITASDLISKMDNGESFIVYFGFNSCPWCRAVVDSLLTSASSNGVNTIYYVDIKNIRDEYTLNDNHEAIRTIEGTEGYYQLLKKFDNVLPNYKSLEYTQTKKVKGKNKTETIKVNIDEKRIYGPSIVLVKNGKPIILTSGISDKIENPYDEITDEMKKYSVDEFNKLFKEIVTTTTSANICTGESNC